MNLCPGLEVNQSAVLQGFLPGKAGLRSAPRENAMRNVKRIRKSKRFNFTFSVSFLRRTGRA